MWKTLLIASRTGKRLESRLNTVHLTWLAVTRMRTWFSSYKPCRVGDSAGDLVGYVAARFTVHLYWLQSKKLEPWTPLKMRVQSGLDITTFLFKVHFAKEIWLVIRSLLQNAWAAIETSRPNTEELSVITDYSEELSVTLITDSSSVFGCALSIAAHALLP